MIDILIIIAFIWLAAASYTDIKKSEVSDWLSFSLVAVALAVRLSESIIQNSYSPILTSLGGLIVFFAISNIMYFGKLFAGGDVKIMTAIGAVMPSLAFVSNILIAGSIYGIIYSIVLASMNPKRFYNDMKKRKTQIFASFLMLILLLFGYALTSNIFVLALGIFIFGITFLFAFINSVEKSCLIKKVDPKNLSEGDWLLKDVKIRGKVVKATFEGLTRSEISLLRKSKSKVYVKYGIPFIPVFLIAFILTIFLGNIFLIFI